MGLDRSETVSASGVPNLPLRPPSAAQVLKKCDPVQAISPRGSEPRNASRAATLAFQALVHEYPFERTGNHKLCSAPPSLKYHHVRPH